MHIFEICISLLPLAFSKSGCFKEIKEVIILETVGIYFSSHNIIKEKYNAYYLVAWIINYYNLKKWTYLYNSLKKTYKEIHLDIIK